MILKAIPNLMPTKNETLNSLNFKVSNCTSGNSLITFLAILVTSLGWLKVTQTQRLWLFLTSNDRGSIKVTAFAWITWFLYHLNSPTWKKLPLLLIPINSKPLKIAAFFVAVKNNTPTHTNGTWSCTCKVTVLHGIGSVMVMVVETWRVISQWRKQRNTTTKKEL